MEEENKNPLIKNIGQVIDRYGCNKYYLHSALFHLKVAKEHLFKKEKQFRCRQDLIDTLLSKLFLDDPDIFPPERYTSQVDENFEWPVPRFPAEAFGKEKFPEIREKDFFECLKVGDILDCRVASVQPMKYYLRVIHKCGSLRLLEDLDIMVTLPRIKLENNLQQNDLAGGELVRVGVSHIEEKNVQVTLDETVLPVTKNIELGKLPETSLPQYVMDPTAATCYASLTDFLNAYPLFQNPFLLKYLLQSYGYDVKRVPSYYSKFNNLKCSEELTGQALLKEARENDFKAFLNAAAKDFKEKNIPAAMDAIQSALALDDKCVKVYEIRGSVYEDLNKPKLNRKALWDFEKVYNLDDNNSTCRKQLSKAQSKTAIKFYKMKKYDKAVVTAEQALTLDKDNVVASKLLEYLKKSHPECFKNLQEEEYNPKDVTSVILPDSSLIVKTEPVD